MIVRDWKFCGMRYEQVGRLFCLRFGGRGIVGIWRGRQTVMSWEKFDG